MTDPKTPPPSGAQSRSKALEPTATATDPQADLLDRLLTQLTSLAGSAKQVAETQTPPTGASTPADQERTKVLFAYEFLGEVLGRLNFAVPKVRVERRFSSQDLGPSLTFFGLPRNSKQARVRAAGGGVQLLTLPDPAEAVPVPVDKNIIPDAQAIDSIVILDILDGNGIPLALGNCLAGGLDRRVDRLA